MNYFRCGGSEKVTIDGVKVKDKMELKSKMFSGVQISVPPGSMTSFVAYNGEIHAFKSGGSGLDLTTHYKWDGTTWTQLSEITSFHSGSKPVVYNNEIHLIAGRNGNWGKSEHYKWDGTTWIKLENFPRPNIYSCAIVVYNNELHVINDYYMSASDGYYEKCHYKWDGTTWTKLEDPPFYRGSAVVYNNEIHMVGCSSTSSGTKNMHYKWDGTTWTQLSNITYPSYNSAFVYNNEIHLTGGNSSNDVGSHYKWDGTTWTQLSNLPHYSPSAGVYNNEIHLVGSRHSVITVPFYILLPYNVVNVYFTPST